MSRSSSHPFDPPLAVDSICELVLEAGDIGRLVVFYSGLGLEVLARQEDRAWLATGERSRLGIWSPGRKEHADRGGRHMHFALSASRGTLDRAMQELRASGVKVEARSRTPAGTARCTSLTPRETASSYGTSSATATECVRVWMR
jgi:catechol-2,3-dioxygenase